MFMVDTENPPRMGMNRAAVTNNKTIDTRPLFNGMRMSRYSLAKH